MVIVWVQRQPDRGRLEVACVHSLDRRVEKALLLKLRGAQAAEAGRVSPAPQSYRVSKAEGSLPANAASSSSSCCCRCCRCCPHF